MSDDGPIVAVGLLTAREMQELGSSLRRLYPVADAGEFEELLRQLDEVDPRPNPPAREPASSFAEAPRSIGHRLWSLGGLLR